jgi:hypothetical protein
MNREIKKNLPDSIRVTTMATRVHLIIDEEFQIPLALAEQVQLQLVSGAVGDDDLPSIIWRAFINHSLVENFWFYFNRDNAVNTDVMDHFLTPWNRVGRL